MSFAAFKKSIAGIHALFNVNASGKGVLALENTDKIWFTKNGVELKGERSMACFLVSAAEAAVTTIASKEIEKKEAEHAEVTTQIPFSTKLHWLRNMLLGGSVLLAFEHLWHGEIVPWFPFLTAAENASDTAAMLQEMATVGVAMAVLITAVWLVMLAVVAVMEKREKDAASAQV